MTFLKWARKLYSTVGISRQNTMNLNKCYFRHIQNETEDKVDISFLLKLDNSVRQFNFSRNPTESLETLLGRISANVQKAIKKATKKKGNSEQPDIQVNFIDIRGDPLPQKTLCKDLFHLEESLHLKIYDQVYEAVFNAPWVVSINLPQNIMAGFPVYPENFDAQFVIKEKTTFNWYTGTAINESGNEISDIHIKWELVHCGPSFLPAAQDVGKKLKLECIPGNETSIGPAIEVVSKKLVEAGPGRCPFETRHMFTKNILTGKSFRCVSYNILADLYCDSDFTRTVLHPYCPPYALHIDYRKQLFMKELVGYNADVICLQEVDKKIFLSCLQPFLGVEGLEGKFYRKGKEVAEGLACFYRKEKFSFLEEHHVLLAEALKTEPFLQSIWNSVRNNQPLTDRVLDRSTVASATILQHKENLDEILLVGNTHLYFHPDADHIRLIQGAIVIYWLRDLRDSLLKKHPNKRVSLIICGDFNSVPSCGIYQLYTTGIAPDTLPDWKSNLNEAVTGLTLKQDIPLASACGTPPFTNFTAGFADCLDYIYYEKSKLEVEQVVPFPSLEELQAHTALPSIVFPSDHIALISDLRFV